VTGSKARYCLACMRYWQCLFLCDAISGIELNIFHWPAFKKHRIWSGVNTYLRRSQYS
jgi:hypothetical protein